VVLDEEFFDNHILRLHDEGWYRGTTTYAPLIIEKQGYALKLVSGPDYQPSFQKGLYSAQILQKVLGVNKVNLQVLMINNYKTFINRPQGALPKQNESFSTGLR
jgi:hypothetical protein